MFTFGFDRLFGRAYLIQNSIQRKTRGVLEPKFGDVSKSPFRVSSSISGGLGVPGCLTPEAIAAAWNIINAF